MQYVILDYLQNYNLSSLMQSRIPTYLELFEKCINTINSRYTDEIVSYTKPMGGFFFLVKFKNPVDTNIFQNGNDFYLDNNHTNETRINICNFSQ